MTAGGWSRVRGGLVGVVTVVVLALVGGIVFVGRGQASPSLHLGSGAAWFPTLRQGSVALIDGATGGRVTRIDGVAKPNGHYEVEQSGSSALVVDHDTGTVTKIDAATWKLSAPVPVGSPGDAQLAVHTGGSSAWVVLQGGSQVQQLDPTAMTLIGAPQTLPSTISGLAVAGDGRLWVTSQSGELRSYRNGEQVTSVPLAGAGATALVLVDRQPVVVDLTRGGAQLVDADQGTPDRSVCLDVPTTPPPVVGGSSGDAPWLLAVGPTAGTLVVSDVGGSSCQAITLGPTASTPRYGAPVEKDRFVFVPDFVSGQVIVVDPQAPSGTQIRARIDLGLPNAQVALLVHNQHVWFNDPAGDQAGVITDDFHALATSKADAGSSTGQTPAAAPTPTPDRGPASPDTPGDPGINADANTPTDPALTPPGSPTDIGLPASPTDLPAPQDNGHRGGDKKPANNGGGGGGGGGGGAATTTTTTPGGAGGAGGSGAPPPAKVVAPVFTISPTPAIAGEPVTFTDATDGAHSLVGWSLPGATPATAKAPSFQATFTEAKTYEITLTISTDVGALSVTRPLTVNTVPRVPPLAGLTVAQAQAALDVVGLKLGTKTATVASIFQAGLIIDSTPAAGAPAPAGSTVAFRDSGGDGIIGSLMGSASAALVYPARLAVDASGNVYIADFEDNRVKEINPTTGLVTLIAGNGYPTSSGAAVLGDGGPAVAATLDHPSSVAVDAQGDVYIGDLGNNRVRKVTRSTGIISTVAGNGSPHNGGLIIPNSAKEGDFTSDTVPGPALATSIGTVEDIALDAHGTLYIVDGDGCNVLLVSRTRAGQGTLSIMPEPQNGWLVAPTSIALGADESIWVAEATKSRILRYDPAGTVTQAVGVSGYIGSTYNGEGTLGPDTVVNQPDTIRFDAFGNLWFTDSENNRIRVLRADDGKVYTAAGNGTAGSAGDGGPASQAQVWLTNSGLYGGLAFDGQGNLYFSDVNIRAIRKIFARPPGG